VKGTTDWTRYEVVLDVPEAALRLAFGPVLTGTGQVWADDFALDVVDPKQVKSTPAPVTYNERAANLDFEAGGATATDPAPGWRVFGLPTEAYSGRIAEGESHEGRAFLEIKSTKQGKPTRYFAFQRIAGGPYRGKRVRFRAYLKTEGVTDSAYISMSALATAGRHSIVFASTQDRGSKGTTDWRPHEVVIDVPAAAEGLLISVVLLGSGTLDVDDSKLEVVDPAEVPLTAKAEGERVDPEKRARELAEALTKMPDRPVNLDFER
jgi:hypothetical protein